MKCVCGYEFKHKWETDDNIQVGDEEFIMINGSLPTNEGVWVEKCIRLCGCPKCGTVRIREWDL